MRRVHSKRRIAPEATWHQGHSKVAKETPSVCMTFVTNILPLHLFIFMSLVAWKCVACVDAILQVCRGINILENNLMFFWPCIIAWTCFNYQLNAQFLYSVIVYILHYNPRRHVSSNTMLILRSSNCIVPASGIVPLCERPSRARVECGLASNQCTERPLTESDDTRCRNNTIWLPEDEHSIARNMSRIIM
jgi:hypothetical protein